MSTSKVNKSTQKQSTQDDPALKNNRKKQSTQNNPALQSNRKKHTPDDPALLDYFPPEERSQIQGMCFLL